MVEDNERDARDRAGQQIFERRLGGAADRDSATVATHPGQPEDIDSLKRAKANHGFALRLIDVFSQLFHCAARDVADLIRLSHSRGYVLYMTSGFANVLLRYLAHYVFSSYRAPGIIIHAVTLPRPCRRFDPHW